MDSKKAKMMIVIDLTKEEADEQTDEQLPSNETQTYWIYAWNKHLVQNDTNRGGKWLIFVALRDLDQTWKLIKKETEEGLLGICAKTATAKENPIAQSSAAKVICVYTYDAADEDDVIRVRERLRQIGFTKKLHYKTNEATLAGKYAHSVPGKVSKYTM